VVGLTAPTVSNIVRRLIGDDLVVEAGQGPSTGGKPRTMLRLNPAARYAVGVQLDPDVINYVVTDLGGDVVARLRRRGAGRRSPAEVVASVAAEVAALVAKERIAPERIVGLGVASPGPLQHEAGVILSPPNLPRWHGVPLRDMLRAATGYPVLIDNDATAAAVAERWQGGAAAVPNFACIYLGAGLGSGIVVNGGVHRGSSSNAGEVGHISVNVDGEPCHCGNRGCVELYCAPRSVVAAARRHLADNPGSQLRLPARSRGTHADYLRICAAALGGEPFAGALIRRAARHLAVAVVSLVNILDLDLVVLAGPGFDHVGELYVDAVRDALARTAFARDDHSLQVRLSPLGEDAGAVGAASLVLHTEFAPQMLGLAAQPAS
jgi:predicted NBD/HSP70 family sugar kinase